jgi:hypothetical protein
LAGGSARRKASTDTGQHNTETRGHTSMPQAGFEPAISIFKLGSAIETGFHGEVCYDKFITSPYLTHSFCHLRMSAHVAKFTEHSPS